MKVKSESEVTQLCLTLSDPMDCSLPGSSVHGIFQAIVLEWETFTLLVMNKESKKFKFLQSGVACYQRHLLNASWSGSLDRCDMASTPHPATDLTLGLRTSPPSPSYPALFFLSSQHCLSAGSHLFSYTVSHTSLNRESNLR